MIAPKPNDPPRETVAAQPTLAFIPGVPILWQLAGIGLIVLVLTTAAGGVVWHFHQRWYGDGYTAASAVYEQRMADQRKANDAAVASAGKELHEAESQLIQTEKERDDALAQIDANAGGDDAGDLGLDARRMRDLGTIK